MTEAVVNIVLGKLAIMKKELEYLGGDGEKVEQVQRELTRIKRFLKDTDMKRNRDVRVQNWLHEVRDVVYRIEDATDTLFVEVYHHHPKKPSFWRSIEKLVHITKNLGKWRGNQHDFSELDNIQHKLQELSQEMVYYGIIDLKEASGEAINTTFQRTAYQEVHETEIVGLQADKANILNLLLLENTPRLTFITIVGSGGVGKTTLAHMVYKSAAAEFEYHMMLSISQKFSLADILRKMLCQHEYSIPENQGVPYLVKKLRSVLKSKRYLIVLDNISTDDLWNGLEYALPDAYNGSRILLTTRFSKIARSAYSNIHELQFLNNRESLDLLIKKAFPSQQREVAFPSDLHELAHEISIKCNGLPLALIVVGGMLSTKKQTYLVWNDVLRRMTTFDWQSDCREILAMCYEDMPYYLKACFLYLGSFPPDCEIFAKRVIRMWVAEGFLPHEEGKTMEQIAEDCLEELCQRGMVQVSSRCMNGSIKCCQLHDLIHDLAMHEAMQENFVTIISQASDFRNPNRKIRRASIYSYDEPRLALECFGPTIRSLLLFGVQGFEYRFLPEFSNFKLLNVLELVGITCRSYSIMELEDLIFLKYLGLKNCDVDDYFPLSLNHMKNLETLDVRGTRICLPNLLWTIGTLRHVLVDDLPGIIPPNGPTSTDNLSNLQTMRWVSAPKEWDVKLPLLKSLCKLGVRAFLDDWVTMTHLLQTLPSLVSLGIKGMCLPMDIVYPKALPNYQNLQSLHLEGKWLTDSLEASLFPPHLVKLTLVDSKLQQNPMPELGMLKCLKKLCLSKHVIDYLGPIICEEGFPVLQYLEVGDSNVECLKVTQGVMPKLRYLQVHTYFDLPPELQHVTINERCLLVPHLDNRPLKVPIHPKHGTKLGGNQDKLKEISTSRVNYVIDALHDKSKGDVVIIPHQGDTSHEVDLQANAIGLQANKLFPKVEGHHIKDPSFLQNPNLGNELNENPNELEETSKSKVDYGIQPMQEKAKGEVIELPFRRAASDKEVNETEIIGLQDDNDKIVKLLCSKETLRRVVITIVGPGGLGKTTLAHMVYRRAAAEFENHMMVSISQKFSLTDLLRKMLSQLGYSIPENHDVPDLISKKLKSVLSSRRYFIVLDDVWTVDLWNQLKIALPDDNNGSRILMTSRFVNVAKSADPDIEPYVLHFLNDTDSRDLLLKKALPSQQPDVDCPSDLVELADKLSIICQGLPLALVVLGDILLAKEKSYHLWERVLRTIDWHSDGKGCMQVLAMSYNDLPYHLQACFMYLAAFPKDYEISTKRLIRMLVAEDFLPTELTETKEQTAQDCLEQLFQRSMIQVSSRYMNGSIKRYQLHDLLRDLAMHEGRQDNFVTVFSHESEVNQPNIETQRASLQSCSPLFMKYVGPKTLSLLLIGFSLNITKFSNFKKLRVLELVGVTSFTSNLLSGFDELSHLKYLGFRNCTMGIDFSSCSFRGMTTLETLDLRGTRTEVPSPLWKIGKLRHVLVDDHLGRLSPNGPISTEKLENLRTMQWISPPKEWADQFPVLRKLCKLGVSNFFDDWVTVKELLPSLKCLVSLGIKGTFLPKEIVYPKTLPKYDNLQSLYLEGKWIEPNTLEASLFPPNLVKLTLVESRLQTNPMQELGKLKSLKKLSLREHVRNYSSRTICGEGFPILQYLEVGDSNIEYLKVEQGVMPKLTYLQVHDDIELHLPHELEHVTMVIR